MTRADQEHARVVAEAWAILTAPSPRIQAFTDIQQRELLMLVHQGFAIGQSIRQLLQLEAALDQLKVREPAASAIALQNTGLEFADRIGAAVGAVGERYYRVFKELDAVTSSALEALETRGLKRRKLREFTSGRVLAAVFVRQWSTSKGLRDVTCKEMEALARITDDRGGSPPCPHDPQVLAQAVDAWKKVFRKARGLLARRKEVVAAQFTR